MATSAAETAVRNYLTALKDPAQLQDQDKISDLENRIEKTDDHLERVLLRQELLEAQTPTLERFEEGFVTHARNWADQQGVGVDAFAEEGVPPQVLRRAGFTVRGGRGSATRRGRAAASRGRTRVSAEQIRQAIPKGTFTVKDVQGRSGASSAVVRRVIQEEVEAGNVSVVGTDPDHVGPGRSPTLYKR